MTHEPCLACSKAVKTMIEGQRIKPALCDDICKATYEAFGNDLSYGV